MKQPDLGLKIIDLRQNKGLTQEELVKQCNISVRTLQRIESGEVVPRGYTLRLISKVLDFDFFSLSQNVSNKQLEKSKTSKSDTMSNLDKTRDILIKRYANLSATSVEKIKDKLKTKPIDEIIKKQNKTIALFKGVVILNIVAVILLFLSVFLAEKNNYLLIFNFVTLMSLQLILQFNYEIKNILKALKEIG